MSNPYTNIWSRYTTKTNPFRFRNSQQRLQQLEQDSSSEGGRGGKTAPRQLYFLLLLALFTLLAAQLTSAAQGDISTSAGTGVAGFSGDGGAATSAQLNRPIGTVVDAQGNVYIADQLNHVVRKVDTNGNITTVAGTGIAGYNGDDSSATSAQLNQPTGVAVDGAGNLFIADQTNHRIRKVDTSGTISTVAGNGTQAFSGDGGVAASAQLAFPTDVTIDGAGNLLIADLANHRIRKIDSSCTISTVAGTGNPGYNGDGVPAVNANLLAPVTVAIDGAGNIFIADLGNNRIRKVDTSGNISTVAGTGTAGFSGDGSAATGAQLDGASGVAVDVTGNLFIADRKNNRIRKVDTSGNISTIAGSGVAGYNGDGIPAVTAQLQLPNTMTVDGDGNLLIADSDNHRMRMVEAVAGSFPSPGVAMSNCPLDDVDLRIIKQAATDGVVAGDELFYQINYSNLSDTAAQNVVIEDMLPEGLDYVSAEVLWKTHDQEVVLQSSGNVVSGTISTLPAFSSGAIILTVRVDPTAPTGNVENIVTIDSDANDPDMDNNTGKATVQISGEVLDLWIQSSVFGVAKVGGQLSYILYYRNLGNRSINNVVITNTLPSEVSYLSHTDEDAIFPMQMVGDELVWSLGELGPSQSGVIRVEVMISDTVPVATDLVNTATIGGDETEVDMSNNSDSVTSKAVNPGSITGTVLLNDGSPIVGAQVLAYKQGTANIPIGARVGADGSYEINGLPAGDYTVHFLTRLGNQIYDDVPNLSVATAVTVISGQTTPNINAKFGPPVPPKVTVEGGLASTVNTAGVVEFFIDLWPPSPVTFRKEIVCANDIEPTDVGLVFETSQNDTFNFPMTGDGSIYSATVLPSVLTVGTFSIKYTCGSETVTEVVAHGLIDPSGFITDAVTGKPIVGARVTLYTINGWVPKTNLADTRFNTCHTLDTRPSVWNDMAPALQIGRMGNPLADPQEIHPLQNPLFTDDTGYYAWDVAAGCWYIVVEADGYETRISPVVGVPPEVTDLHLTMNPIPGPPTSMSIYLPLITLSP